MVLELFGPFSPLINAVYEMLAFIGSFFSLTMANLQNQLSQGLLRFGFTNVFTGEYKYFTYISGGNLADTFYKLITEVLGLLGGWAGIPLSAPLYVWLFVGIGVFWIIMAVFIAIKKAFLS